MLTSGESLRTYFKALIIVPNWMHYCYYLYIIYITLIKNIVEIMLSIFPYHNILKSKYNVLENQISTEYFNTKEHCVKYVLVRL